MTIPKEHHAKLRSTNGLERVNGKVKRRIDVLGPFPTEAAVKRLIGAILLEINDESTIQRGRSMTLETIAQLGEDTTVTLSVMVA